MRFNSDIYHSDVVRLSFDMMKMIEIYDKKKTEIIVLKSSLVSELMDRYGSKDWKDRMTYLYGKVFIYDEIDENRKKTGNIHVRLQKIRDFDLYLRCEYDRDSFDEWRNKRQAKKSKNKMFETTGATSLQTG